MSLLSSAGFERLLRTNEQSRISRILPYEGYPLFSIVRRHWVALKGHLRYSLPTPSVGVEVSLGRVGTGRVEV
jgi:hypothetical protein